MSVPADQMQAGLAGAVDSGVAAANAVTPEMEASQAELDEVKKLTAEYVEARSFDEYARKQYNRDRRYAQGVADLSWASDANIIGAFIDILVSFLYAQNPDVSCRPAAQAGGQPDKNAHMFSETLQIVISKLWKSASLKKTMRRCVRSSLSVSVGWFKAIMYSDTKRNPEVEKQLNDTRDNLAQIEAIQKKILEDGDDATSYDEKITQLNNQMAGLQANVEIIIKRGLCVDFCRAEDMQVSLDISDTIDYLDADWMSNDMYVRKSQLEVRFPQLTEDDRKSATIYYQKQTGPGGKDTDGDSGMAGDASAEGQYTKSTTGVQTSGGKPIEFVKIVELWDHRDNLIKTFVEGIKRWAVVPYPPPQASTRFYPYFRLAFFETDGARHPQSLSWRLKKLQDEYSGTRSAGLITKQRSIPGTIFNRGQLSPEDARKIEQSVHMEMIGIELTTPDADINKVITGKPVPRVDPMLFDTTPCQRDMEVLSGVQEAQQGAVSSAKTATEAEIQQSGFSSRTGADRDMEEELLNDLALYTAELAVQSLDVPTVQRLAGPMAFWPAGMDPQDVMMMLDVEITAGTTGKPQARSDKEAWATLLPLIQQMMTNIQQLDLTNPPLAQGYRNLLRETLRRLDDRLDVDSIMPPPAPPQIDPLTGQPIIAAPPGVGGPPGAPGAAPPGAPPVGNGTVNNPVAQGAPPA